MCFASESCSGFLEKFSLICGNLGVNCASSYDIYILFSKKRVLLQIHLIFKQTLIIFSPFSYFHGIIMLHLSVWCIQHNYNEDHDGSFCEQDTQQLMIQYQNMPNTDSLGPLADNQWTISQKISCEAKKKRD